MTQTARQMIRNLVQTVGHEDAYRIAEDASIRMGGRRFTERAMVAAILASTADYARQRGYTGSVASIAQSLTRGD